MVSIRVKVRDRTPMFAIAPMKLHVSQEMDNRSIQLRAAPPGVCVRRSNPSLRRKGEFLCH